MSCVPDLSDCWTDTSSTSVGYFKTSAEKSQQLFYSSLLRANFLHCASPRLRPLFALHLADGWSTPTAKHPAVLLPPHLFIISQPFPPISLLFSCSLPLSSSDSPLCPAVHLLHFFHPPFLNQHRGPCF